MFTFFYAPHTCSLASHIALEEAGLPYEAKRLNFPANEQRGAEYLAINPKGRVPALVTERGVLTETPAILVFIAQSIPAARLAPLEDAYAFAQLQAFNSYLCSTVHVAYAHFVRGYRWADDEASLADMKRKVPGNMADCFALIEREMLAGPWAMGGQYTVADPYLYTVARWLERAEVDVARFPKVQDHMRRIEERPAVRRVLAEVFG